MKLPAEVSKVMTHKYFLYFMGILAVFNVWGYVVAGRRKAVLFFALIALITHHFSKNMATVLLVAVVSTSLLVSTHRLHEGLTNANPDPDNSALNHIESKDHAIAAAIPAVRDATSNEQLKETLDKKKEQLKQSITDINNADLNKPSTETTTAPEGFGESISGKGSKQPGGQKSRLDYAATIEDSYQNLDKMLGTDSIQNLTKDTKDLMQQQQKLFDTMQNMVPVLQGAQSMLQKFDIGGLTKSLTNMGGVSGMKL